VQRISTARSTSWSGTGRGRISKSQLGNMRRLGFGKTGAVDDGTGRMPVWHDPQKLLMNGPGISVVCADQWLGRGPGAGYKALSARCELGHTVARKLVVR
jgi:hypothetical protein